MKKRVKLITSIASLGLALALMTFGVLAATQVTLGITSTVSFTVTDVFCNITGAAYLDPVASAGTTTDGIQYATVSTYTGTGDNMEPISAGVETAALTSWEIGEIKFTSVKDCIVYKLTIANIATTGSVDVSVSVLPVAVNGTTVTAVYVYSNDGGEATGLAANTNINVLATETLVITITRTLTKKNTTIENTSSWAPTVSVTNHLAS